MANDIKQKIVLEGEKQYNQALNEAKRNLKTLRSELKAETAELGNNATAQQKNEAKVKSLQKQIKEQEKVVRTYQAALKEVKENYADNEDAVAKWEQKLNDARATLANMKNDLDGVGQSFDKIKGSADMATVATKSIADSFGRLSEIGGSISDSIQSVFTSMVSVVKETITQVWGDIVDLAARSNNLVDLAGFWNTDVLTIQKYQGAVAEASASLEDLNGIVTKINSKESKDIMELVGVSKENYKDQWKYAMAVMDAMSKMTTEQRNAVGFELFGKSATKAFDLLNDWKTVLDNLDKYDAENGGYGLSGEELQTMSELYDKVNGLKQSWQSLKNMATVKLFGDLSINLTGNAQAILDGFLQYFNAGSDAERNEALAKIEENIMAMFETAKQAIEDGVKLLDQIAEDLKNSDNPTAKALGNILSGLVDALQWLTEDNMNNVVKALEVLAAFWLTGKGLQMAGAILEVVKNINVIKAFSGGGSMLGGAGAGAAAGAAGGATGTNLATTLGTFAVKAVPWLAGLTTLFENAIKEQGNDDLFNPDGTPTELGKKQGYTQSQGYYDKGGKPENKEDDGSTFELKFGPIVKSMEEAAEEISAAVQEKEEPKDWRPGYQQLTGGSFYNPNMPTIEEAAAKIAEVVEDVLLEDEYTDQDRENAIQDWWDSWRENAEDEAGNFDWMQEVFGDEFGSVWDRIIQGLDELGDKQMEMEDIPAEWWRTQGGNAGNTDGLTSADARSMTAAVNKMPGAVARGVSGIKVFMDGRAVGHLVAPYVSSILAADIG